jgi:Zn-dependent M28 family amino/carboxypeptidase
MAWLENDQPYERYSEVRGSATITEDAMAAMFAGSRKTAAGAIADARKKPSPLALKGVMKMSKNGKLAHMTSPNVAAILRGSDPTLRNEYVVYTAHADHLGIGVAINGDTIYNGALDDASGTSGLIEIARAFSMMETKPARSILFVAVTAEERGLLGSEYFAHHPTVSVESIVANINIDGLPSNASADIVPLGAEHSTLLDNIRRATAVVQYEISPDPEPGQNFFIRSDQYSFVKQGVPSVFVVDGEKSVDPKVNLAQVNAEWRAFRYHSPSDDIDQPIDFNAMAKFAQLDFLIGLDVATQTARPAWNANDIFGKKYGRK